MPVSDLPLAVRLHRYAFLVSADLITAGTLVDQLPVVLQGDASLAVRRSQERELFRQLTGLLRCTAPEAQTNLVFVNASSPVSPASFAAALWGMPFTTRAILVLLCVEGFSLADTAFIVNMPLSQAEQSVARAFAVFETAPAREPGAA